MKIVAALTIGGILFLSNTANATGLIGETLTFARAYPTTTTPFWNPSSTTTTVAVGTGDVITWKWLPGVSGTTSINPEANSITWSGTISEYIGNQTTFDGFIVSGFSHDITNVSVLNSGGFAIDISLALRSFSVNLSGTGSGFALSVQSGADSTLPGNNQLPPVPEPSTLALVGAGFMALFLTRKLSRTKDRLPPLLGSNCRRLPLFGGTRT